MKKVIGIDIGGTGIKGSVISEIGELLDFQTVSTDASKGRDHVLKKVHQMIQHFIENHTIDAIGIGSAGRINTQEAKVVYATDNLPQWIGLNFIEKFGKMYSLPVFVDNDVNVAALGEAWMGAGKNIQNFFFLALGTGVGGGIVIHDDIFRGNNWSAGEVGHMILYPRGKECNCGQKGCVEQYISGTALLNHVNETGHTFEHGNQIWKAYKEENQHIQACVESFIQDLSMTLHNIKILYDPEVIIMGGGLSDSHCYWEEALTKELQSFGHDPSLVKWATLGNKAGQFGSAKLALDSIK
ncbi:glucokinase [Bacillus pakistanensis]|uniref:Glucokinase n=1 Tax=Rossellomorea pakistanensis TaxID=992288 RepID=A0ABS2NDL5_9BACI|nr:ROK family protein [Bacillus pakistanensis]MBM7585909.1 glucokinase [Bacillus pakistanensis]